jgi:hypothetical protein
VLQVRRRTIVYNIPSDAQGEAKRSICVGSRAFKGLALKILTEKYFVWKSHKIRRETRGSPGECDFLRNPLAYNKTNKQNNIKLYLICLECTNDDPYGTSHGVEHDCVRFYMGNKKVDKKNKHNCI